MNCKAFFLILAVLADLGCVSLSAEKRQDLKALSPSAKRIVAIGDLHGDYAATLKALQLAGAIDQAGRWVGGEMVLVQTGDQIDRGDDDRQIIDLFERLRVEAKAAGGAVHAMCGNHEAMNVYGDFRYVTEGSFKDFTQHAPEALEPLPNVPAAQQARALAFAPGGRYAKILANRPIMLVVGQTAFVHGGIRPEHVKLGIDLMNKQTADWMLGSAPMPAFVKEQTGPLWMREYSEAQPTAAACSMLKETLDLLRIRRMVVGHTVQEKGISAACDERVWRIDLGMSAYYKKNKIQVLELLDESVKVLSAPR